MIETNADPGTQDPRRTAAALLDIVDGLSRELHPERSATRIGLDSELDRELGFDSLSRVELLLRLERGLGVQLPEAVLSAAETPGDLLAAVLTASPRGHRASVPPKIEPITLGAADTPPAEVDTLQGVLAWRATHQGDRPHVQLYGTGSAPAETVTFAALHDGACRRAAGLLRHGLAGAEAVAIMLPTGREYLESFFAVLLAGGVPVPIYPPARASQLEDHLRRHAAILANAGARLLITLPEGKAVGRLLERQAHGLGGVVTPAELLMDHGISSAASASGDDVALLQYTSGSTGQPKGVILTHAHLLANIRAMGARVGASSSDVFVSWLPLYHDMGLIGAWLGSLYYAMTAVLMPPLSFLARPARWLRTIHVHRGTISAAPNFAYELCLSKVDDAELAGIDLSCWRLAVNGAEPVSPQTIRRFGERFRRFGFDPKALTPVYGLAECAVGLTFPPLQRGPVIDRIQRRPLELTGRAMPAAADDPTALEYVACGHPLEGYEVRIVDSNGRELAERQQGRLEFRGPSATRGYIANPDATLRLFDGDWLDSGDLAYLSGGDVFLTSRVKDLIIRGGRNLYPYDLEEAVGDLEGIRKGCVAVFGSSAPGSAQENLVVLAETRESAPATRRALRQRIETLTSELLGIPPDDVRLVPPRTVLKTSSGKIRRAACRDLYQRGRLGRGPAPAPVQLARLWLAALRPAVRHRLQRLRDLCYAGYVYVVFGILCCVAILVTAMPVTLERRWSALRRCALGLLALARIPLAVDGRQHLSMDTPYVLVANHASYLDGLILLAVAPRPLTFVAKSELRRRWLSHWFLRRLGARFVARFDVAAGRVDAGRMSRQAAAGHPLMVFAEGTFTRAPGLLPFRLGAFVAAVDAGLPVVPVTIRGTRSVLRGDDWFPRRGAIVVIIGSPISPAGSGWKAALALRNATRQAIALRLGEPDLATATTVMDGAQP